MFGISFGLEIPGKNHLIYDRHYAKTYSSSLREKRRYESIREDRYNSYIIAHVSNNIYIYNYIYMYNCLFSYSFIQDGARKIAKLSCLISGFMADITIVTGSYNGLLTNLYLGAPSCMLFFKIIQNIMYIHIQNSTNVFYIFSILDTIVIL